VKPSTTLSGLVIPPSTTTTGRWIPAEYRPGCMTRGTHLTLTADGILVTPDHLCPDLLRYSNIGPADGWRGRAVRAFFWLMRLWPPRGTP
jgi:hypothetical protein